MRHVPSASLAVRAVRRRDAPAFVRVALACAAFLSSGCASPLPAVTAQQRALMLAIAEPICIDPPGKPGAGHERADRAGAEQEGTATRITVDLALIVRHGIDGLDAARLRARGSDIRGAIIARGSGQVSEPGEGWAWSLDQVMTLAAGDWQLVRRARALDHAQPRLPVESGAVRAGDRVLLAGWRPRRSGTSADIDTEADWPWFFRPDFWCTVGQVSRVDALGAFSVICENRDNEGGGCSGGPAVKLDPEGRPIAIVGIFVGTYTGPAFPELVRTWAVCAPVAPVVVEAAGPP